MDPINWSSVFFLIFALLACGLAVAVVITANVVRMAFYLVMALAAVAGLFFLAGAEFLGAMQIMIYVGGTMVLVGLRRHAHRPRAVRLDADGRRAVGAGHDRRRRAVGRALAVGLSGASGHAAACGNRRNGRRKPTPRNSASACSASAATS